VHCHTVDSLGLKGKARRSLGGQAAALMNSLNVRRVTVSPLCPVALVRELEKAGVQVQVSRQPVCPERIRKSEREIKQLRKSQRAAVFAMKQAFAGIRESGVDGKNRLRQSDGSLLTAEVLRRRIETALLDVTIPEVRVNSLK